LVREASRIGVLERVKVGHSCVDVKFLQFEYDTLFFCQPNFQSIMALKMVLCCFEITFGLKINFHKSYVGTLGVNDMDKLLFSNCLNCDRMDMPFKCLGMNIGENPRFVAFWMPVIDKTKSRLSVWKGKLISMAGRLCLLSQYFILYLYFICRSSKHLLVCTKSLRKYWQNLSEVGVVRLRKLLGWRGIKFFG